MSTTTTIKTRHQRRRARRNQKNQTMLVLLFCYVDDDDVNECLLFLLSRLLEFLSTVAERKYAATPRRII